jgi:CO/xanthine dehydrogenase FAD-binding subunit
MWQAYEMPSSVDEALAILARYNGQAQIIAGGTDLMVELQECKRTLQCLVDVTRIPGLDRIEEEGDWIVMGANVTFRQIKDSPLLRQQARVLCEAAASVGALQIQTVATLAGNVVSALPAADGSVALVALDAEARVAARTGQQWQPVAELFLGPGKSAIDPAQQMLTAIRIPVAGARHGSAWERIGRRRALVLPILNCAVSLALADAGGPGDHPTVEWARIGLGPVAPVPFRARETEAYLAGRPAGEETYASAAEVAASEAHPRSSLLRASKEYRSEVLKVLVRRGLARAVEQVQERIA